MQQTVKPSLFNLITYALSTVVSNPVLPRWMQDLSPEEAAARQHAVTRAVTPPPRKRSVSSEVRITVGPLVLPQQQRMPLQQRPQQQRLF